MIEVYAIILSLFSAVVLISAIVLEIASVKELKRTRAYRKKKLALLTSLKLELEQIKESVKNEDLPG